MTTFLQGPAVLMGVTALVSGALSFFQSPSSLEPLDIMVKDNTVSSYYTEEALKDQIVNLPGLNYDPGFQQFSGYFTVDEDHGRNLFYWYVESQGNPEEDPVVLWTNGGPGCSGFVGFGTEHGPYFINKNGTLSPNPFSWNLLANMLYIEQPAGVGFSYSDTKTDYTTGDAQAASDNYKFIQEFLKRFPERSSNPFYISSESYGGHYMPQLTLEILNRDVDKTINFKGMLVGNPFVDPFSNTITQIESFYSHGLLPKPLFDEWKNQCTTPETYDTEQCQKMEYEMFKGLYHKINPYALDYPICIEDEVVIDTIHHSRRLNTDPSSQAEQLISYNTAGGPPFLPTEDVYRPCSDQHLKTYLNRDDVKEAIHVSPKASKKWHECSNTVDYSVQDFDASIIDLYKELIQRACIENDLQVFIFSGDDDSVCSTAGTQYWIYDLGWAPKADFLWNSWTVEGEVAGYVTDFELEVPAGQGRFVFATVHGAGHEVPAYRPMEALEMFRRVLVKEW